MAKENVAKFFEQLAADKALAEKLAAADKAYAEQHQGEQADEAAKKAAAGAIVLPLAKEAGFDFTAEELFAYEQEKLEELAGELSDEEMANAAGGRKGPRRYGDVKHPGGGAVCAYIGLGLGRVRDLEKDTVTVCMIIGLGDGVGAGTCSGTGKM